MPRRECRGRPLASAGANHHPHAASGGRNAAPQGDSSAHRFFGNGAPGCGGSSMRVGKARRQGSQRTPRGAPHQPRRTPPHSLPTRKCGGAPKRVARRPGRAKLPDPDETPPPAPQETPQPHNPTTPQPHPRTTHHQPGEASSFGPAVPELWNGHCGLRHMNLTSNKKNKRIKTSQKSPNSHNA